MKAIKTTYKGPTDRTGSRIIARDGDNNRVTIPYPHELDSEEAHRKAANALCERMGWEHGVRESGWLENATWVHLLAAPCNPPVYS